MAGSTERVKEYEVAFVAKLLESETVQKGLESMTKGVQSAGLKAKGFFDDIRKFIPDLSIFNKLLGLAGVSGVLSFGAITSMMPQVARAMARAKQEMRRLAHFLGPVLEPAIEAISSAISKFVSKLIALETKYGIFKKIAAGIKWVFDELVRIEEKYSVIDKLFKLADATFDFTIKAASYIDDILPDWIKEAIEFGLVTLTIGWIVSKLPIIGGLVGLLTKLGWGFLGAMLTAKGLVAIPVIFTLAATAYGAGKVKDKLKDLYDKHSREDIEKVPGFVGEAGKAAYDFEGWTRKPLGDKMWDMTGFPMGGATYAAGAGANAGANAAAQILGIKIIVDERGMFLGIEPDNGATSARLS